MKTETRQKLFDYFSQEHNISLMDSDFNELENAFRDAVEAEKIYEIDFAGNVKVKIIIKDNTPVIEAAMNGWGNPIDPKDVTIDELSYQPKQDKP